jgi:hypothetical protein
MADQEREAAYNAALRKSMKAWADADVQMAADVRAAIIKYRDAAVATLADPASDWGVRQRQQTIARLRDAADQMDRDLGQAFNQAMDAAVGATIQAVDDPLTAFGVNVAQYRPVLPTEQIALIKSVAPTMIADVTTQVHQQVQGELLRFALGGAASRQQVLERIGNLTGPLGKGEMKPGQVIPRAEVRARAIFRTEMNRVSNVTSTARLDDLAKRDTGFGKKWVHYYSPDPRPDHAALHGKVIYPGKGEKFELGGIRIDGPYDPALPAADVINCRCKVVAHYNPTQSEATGDPLVAAAPSGSSAPAATPEGAPKPAKSAAEKKPAKAKAAKPAADGPVTVKKADTSGGSTIPKAPVAEPVAKAKAKKAARDAVDPATFATKAGSTGERFYVDHVAAQTKAIGGSANEFIYQYQEDSSGLTRRMRRRQKFRDGIVATDEEFSEHYKTFEAGMMQALDAAPALDDSVVLWRGLESGWPGVTIPANAAEVAAGMDATLVAQTVSDSLVGGVIRDAAFSSTSLNEAVASVFGSGSGVVFRIEAPAGTRGLWAGVHEDYQDQREFILAPSTKLRVIRIERSVQMETKDSYFGESQFEPRTVVHVRIEA